MPTHRRYRLGSHLLDASSGELRCGEKLCRLTPKATQVLLALGEAGADIVSKEALFRAVWAGRVVSDAALATCIQELRAALGDDARHPRVLQTVHRRGFRLLMPLERIEDSPPASGPSAPLLVGRAAELELLRTELSLALGNRRRLVFVSGEAGIGKTTLLDALLADVDPRVTRATGRCVEHYGPREPYLPLLDAVGSLGRGPFGTRLLALLRRLGPGWLAQLPALVDEAELATLARRAVGMTGARMLRELTDVLEALAAEAPLILRLEDLHWADPATLDWLAFIARRTEPARLLILVTMRPAESLPRGHPLVGVHAELAPREQCRDLLLGPLAAEAVREYLAHRLDASPEELRPLADAIHARTEGNPLFVTHVVDSVLAQGIAPSAEAIAAVVPAQLRLLIDLHLERLSAAELDLLTVAAALGASFSADIVAQVRDLRTEAAEGICTALARRGAFIAATAEVTAERRAASRFRFRHALYRAVLYERLPVATRAALHARIGEILELRLGASGAERATELADHFDRGRRPARAAHYYYLAGTMAARRSAPRAAVDHFRQALALFEQVEDGAERRRRELESCIALGAQLLASAGWGAPEAARMYARAQELCSTEGVSQESFAALWGLWMYRWGRAELPDARRLGERLESLACEGTDRAMQLQAHHALWATSLSRGELAACSEHAAAGGAIYDTGEHAVLAARFGNHDAGACAAHFHAMAQALRGEAGHARRGCARALALTEQIEHPFSHVIALYFAAAVHQVLREPESVRGFADRAVKVAGEHGFTLLGAWAAALRAAATTGPDAGTIEQMRAAIGQARATGTEQFQTFLHAVLAGTCLDIGARDEARAAVEEGLRIAAATQERFYEAELLRLDGLLAPDTESRSRRLWQAVDLAQKQGAVLLQLRAGVSLLESTGEDAERVRGLLREALERLSGDAAGADARAARSGVDGAIPTEIPE